MREDNYFTHWVDFRFILTDQQKQEVAALSHRLMPKFKDEADIDELVQLFFMNAALDAFSEYGFHLEDADTDSIAAKKCIAVETGKRECKEHGGAL